MEVFTMLKSEYGKTIILNNWRGVEIIETVADARRNEITDLVECGSILLYLNCLVAFHVI